MRGRIFGAILLLLWSFPVRALLPGETSVEPEPKLEWVNCSPMPLGKISPERHPNVPALRGVVFLYTRADDSDALVSLLENARRSFAGKVLIAIITPDDMADARELQQRHADSRLRLAVDLERKITPQFMRGGSMILPCGFLLDADGKTLWRGEAADLPEAADLALAGKLDVEVQKRAAPLVEQTQRALREGSMPRLLRAAEQLLAVDPGHPAALRMAVFAAESMRNSRQAWEITTRQRQKASHLARLRFTALELILHHPELRDQLPGLIEEFRVMECPARLKYAFADALLRNFPYESAAVLGAGRILRSAPLGVRAAPEEMAMVLALKARLAYALGDLPGAEEFQRESVQLYRRSEDGPGRAEAERMLAFFRALRQETAGPR